MIVLAASLPVATSVNALHDRSKRLTPEAREYKTLIATLLHYYPLLSEKERHKFDPYFILYQNNEQIKIARSLIGNKSKSKAVLAMHKKYAMDILLVVDNEGRDLDNVLKLFIDCISEFLGFNDNRVIRIHSKKLVDKTVPPHMEVIVRHEDVNWHSGILMEQAKMELDLDHMYDENYNYERFKESENIFEHSSQQ
jgi:Holliday junction resolvase RusA-like endonuclease